MQEQWARISEPGKLGHAFGEAPQAEIGTQRSSGQTGILLSSRKLSLPYLCRERTQLQLEEIPQATFPEGARSQRVPVLRLSQEIRDDSLEAKPRKDLWGLPLSSVSLQIQVEGDLILTCSKKTQWQRVDEWR